MTVQKLYAKNIYKGNGSNKSFPFTFECPENHPEFVRVFVRENYLTETTNFAIDMQNRIVTYPVDGDALPEGANIIIARELPLTQVMNLINNGPFFAEDIETAFDELTMMVQQLNEKANRTLTVELDNSETRPVIPVAPGKGFAVNEDGTGFILTTNPDIVAANITAALGATEASIDASLLAATNYVNQKVAATEEGVANSISVLEGNVNTAITNNTNYVNDKTAATEASVNTSLANTQTTVNNALAENQRVVNEKVEQVQDLVDSLGGLTIEALEAVRDECLEKAGEAQDAADRALASAGELQGAVAQVATNTQNISSLSSDKADKSDTFTKTEADNRYLKLSGGTLSNNINFGGIEAGQNRQIGFSRSENGNVGAIRAGRWSNGNPYMYFFLANNDGTLDTADAIGIQRGANNKFVTQAPTPATDDNSTKIATTSYVKSNLAKYLPLSGGTVTGDLILKNNNIDIGNISAKSNTDFAIRDKNNKSIGVLRNTVDVDGSIETTMTAINYLGTDQKWSTITAKRYADGSETYRAGNKEIERIEASGFNYIRYSSGIQMCWDWISLDNTVAPGGYNTVQWTFPLPFVRSYYLFGNPNHDRFNVSFYNPDANGATVAYVNDSSSGTFNIGGIWVFAIGRWK